MRTKEEIKIAKEGWTNWLKGESVSPEIKEMSEQRMDICISCPLLVYSVSMERFGYLANGVKYLLGKPVEKADGHKCSICGCQFKAMSLAPSKECPYYENAEGYFIPLGWPQEVENAAMSGLIIKKPKWGKRPDLVNK